MSSLPPASSSRREWLGRFSTSALAVSLGTAAFDHSLAAANDAPRTPGGLSLGARLYDVREFGARGDGAMLDTQAVQGAIDACTKDGGGTVVVPAGDFLVGTLELKNNVTLRSEEHTS